MLNHFLNRIHFSQTPDVVLDYITTTRYWPDWHLQSRRVEGVTNRPMQIGDQCVEYFEWNNMPGVVQWTTVDRWKSNMYRIHGRTVADGKVKNDVTVSIHYTLFATADGGTDFTREMEFIAPDLGPMREPMLKLQEQSLQKIKEILDAAPPRTD